MSQLNLGGMLFANAAHLVYDWIFRWVFRVWHRKPKFPGDRFRTLHGFGLCNMAAIPRRQKQENSRAASGLAIDYGGKGEMKCRPLVGVRFEPDFSTIPLDDSLANGKADAGAGVFSALGMKTFEDGKDLRVKLRRDANAIVGNGKQPKAAGGFSRDVHAGAHLVFAIL